MDKFLMSRQRIFDHYLMLCKEPGWKDYAWQRVKELDKEPVYAGIKDYIMEQMNAPSSKD
jgi:hypothetical protein